MKKIILTIILLKNCALFAQNNIELGFFYTFTDNIEILELQESDITINKENLITIDNYIDRFKVESTFNLVGIKEGWMFKVVKKAGQLYVIKIINQVGYENKIFGLTKHDIINYTKLYQGNIPKRSFVTSAVTIPVKIRPGDGKSGEEKNRYFDFEGNVNIGITAGLRDRISKNGKSYLSYLGGISIGSTKITSGTVSEEFDSETNASVLTPFIGILYEYDDFQIGFFTGWDHIGGKLGKNWDYQGKTWIGIGLGYNIFTTKDKNPEVED